MIIVFSCFTVSAVSLLYWVIDRTVQRFFENTSLYRQGYLLAVDALIVVGNWILVTPLAMYGHVDCAGYYGALYGLVIVGTFQLFVYVCDGFWPVRTIFYNSLFSALINMSVAILFNSLAGA